MSKKENINKLTIVGGQPSRKNSSTFSTSIEKLLLKAASDEKIRKILLNSKEDILEKPEFSLSPQDKIILKSIPFSRLCNMIKSFSIQKTSRRKFLKNAAASIAILTTGVIFPSCDGRKKEFENDLKEITSAPTPEIGSSSLESIPEAPNTITPKEFICVTYTTGRQAVFAPEDLPVEYFNESDINKLKKLLKERSFRDDIELREVMFELEFTEKQVGVLMDYIAPRFWPQYSPGEGANLK